jgi:hypothetical protein
MKNRLEYKLDLLQMEGQGFNRTETVQHLAEKHGVSERVGYYYFKTRSRWQPEILGLETAKDAYHQTLNRLEYIYRHFSLIASSAPENSNRVGALKGMLETVIKKAEITGVLAPSDMPSINVDAVLDEATFKSLTPEENLTVVRATSMFLQKRQSLQKNVNPLFVLGENHEEQ